MSPARRIFYTTTAFILTAGAVLAFMHQVGLFRVGSIPIELRDAQGEALDARDAVVGLKERLLGRLAKFNGRKIWEIDLDEVRASLARDEWVRDVLISRSLPNQIKISVTPKRAAVVLVSQDGKFLPVTEEGSLLSALPAGVLPDVPLLRGEVFSHDRKRRVEAVRFARALAEGGPMSPNNVSEITWNASDGYAVTLIQPKLEVKLGEEKIEMKALRVAQVLNYLSANNLKGRTIDASFSKKVLVRLRKGP